MELQRILHYKHNTDINRIKYEQNPDIVCLQETNFKNLHIGNINEYSGYKKNHPNALRASGGVATYIKNNINSKEIYVNSNLEVIAVQVILKTTITICNIYIPDSTPLPLLDLNSIITQLPKPFLILGDFNSRNILWGSSHTDSCGKTIDKLLENPSLILLNNGDPTRHNSTNSSLSAIDLTISSTNFAPELD